MRGNRCPATVSTRQPRGQVIVIAALAMVSLIGGVALVLEAGNAYANQREAQNGADAVANAGASVLSERLAGLYKDRFAGRRIDDDRRHGERPFLTSRVLHGLDRPAAEQRRRASR